MVDADKANQNAKAINSETTTAYFTRIHTKLVK